MPPGLCLGVCLVADCWGINRNLLIFRSTTQTRPGRPTWWCSKATWRTRKPNFPPKERWTELQGGGRKAPPPGKVPPLRPPSTVMPRKLPWVMVGWRLEAALGKPTPTLFWSRLGPSPSPPNGPLTGPLRWSATAILGRSRSSTRTWRPGHRFSPW